MLDVGFTTEDQSWRSTGRRSRTSTRCVTATTTAGSTTAIPLKQMVNERGCQKLGIHNLQGGIVTRGVLIDIPRLKGVQALEGEHAGLRRGHRSVGETGRRENLCRRRHLPAYRPLDQRPDLGVRHLGRALAERRGTSRWSGPTGRSTSRVRSPNHTLPLHKYVLVALGMNIIDNADFAALAATAARLKRWEFMFVAGPIATPGRYGIAAQSDGHF